MDDPTQVRSGVLIFSPKPLWGGGVLVRVFAFAAYKWHLNPTKRWHNDCKTMKSNYICRKLKHYVTDSDDYSDGFRLENAV